MPDKTRKADERDAEIADLKQKLAEAKADAHLATLTLQRYQEFDREQLVKSYAGQLEQDG